MNENRKVDLWNISHKINWNKIRQVEKNKTFRYFDYSEKQTYLFRYYSEFSIALTKDNLPIIKSF